MKKTITLIGFLLLYSSFYLACKSANVNPNKNTLQSKCILSLNIKGHELSKEDLSTMKQFLSKNGCNKETIAFAKRAIEAMEKGDMKKASLACLNKYFELNQNSPFNLAFGGVFNCEDY